MALSFYTLTLRTVLISHVPILGDVQSVTESQVLVTVQGGHAVHETCAVSVDATLGKTQLESGFLQALPTLYYPWSGEEEELDLLLDPIAMGYGGGSSFPTHIKHPAVEDSDSDGKPGVTITLQLPILGEVEMLVAQHTRTQLSGRMVAEGRWEGTTNLVEFEQIILQSGHSRLREPPEVVPGVGSFVLQELSGPTSCTGLTGNN
ncbi:MAG: hypothetical protein ACI9VR_004299 [Cognaticolwellia sp.]